MFLQEECMLLDNPSIQPPPTASIFYVMHCNTPDFSIFLMTLKLNDIKSLIAYLYDELDNISLSVITTISTKVQAWTFKATFIRLNNMVTYPSENYLLQLNMLFRILPEIFPMLLRATIPIISLQRKQNNQYASNHFPLWNTTLLASRATKYSCKPAFLLKHGQYRGL